MRRRLLLCTALLGILIVAPTLWAERAPEERTEATHVVIGTVEGVYVRTDGAVLQYLVEIAVEKVEKGDGLKPGDTVHIKCYLRNPDWLKGKKLTEKEQKEEAMRGSGYDGVPREGERVKVYARRWGSKYLAIFPSWYDSIKAK